MKKLFLTLMVLGFFGVCAAGESYGQITPRADARQKLQNKRIKRGIRNESLTGKEAARLANQQQNVRQYERQIKSDGTVTLEERARLQHKENKASRSIYKAKHNNKSRN